MKISYDKLWKKVKANKMKKRELAEAAEISTYTMTKLNQDRVVSMDVMIRLCKIFHCDIGDLMEVIED
jgi:DNA-binding Xre family transcriptional regulator